MTNSEIYYLGLGFFCCFIPMALCWWIDRSDLARELERRRVIGRWI